MLGTGGADNSWCRSQRVQEVFFPLELSEETSLLTPETETSCPRIDMAHLSPMAYGALLQ